MTLLHYWLQSCAPLAFFWFVPVFLFCFLLFLVCACLGLDRFEHAADPLSDDPDPLPSIRAGDSWRAVFLVPAPWGWTLPRGLPLATMVAASSAFSGKRCSKKARQGECGGTRIDALVPCCSQCTMVGGGVRHFLVRGHPSFGAGDLRFFWKWAALCGSGYPCGVVAWRRGRSRSLAVC